MSFKKFREDLLVLREFMKEQKKIEKALDTILYEPSLVSVGDGLLKAHIELLEKTYKLEFDSIWNWYYEDNADKDLIKEIFKQKT